MRGSRLSGSALLYLYSNICAPHRRDCCALFAYETALCDRKDTQSRFAVNAARSIVCVETFTRGLGILTLLVSMPHAALCVLGQRQQRHSHRLVDVSMPHAALCVLGQTDGIWPNPSDSCFNAARSIVCVGTICSHPRDASIFVSMPHAALCVLGRLQPPSNASPCGCFNAARSIVCVGT